MSDFIKTAFLDNRVCEIGIDRPDKKNALNFAMYEALADALLAAQQSPKIRSILLYGSGGVFTAGNDLTDFAILAAEPESLHNNPVIGFMRQLARCEKPVVCAVDGLAVGIGCTLLLHCDLIYATPASRFSLPFIDLGLCPEYASSLLIPRLAGYPKAAEWLMLGEPFSAQDALSAGLVNGICEDALATARQQCLTLAAKAPKALRTTKRLLRSRQAEMDEVMEQEVKAFAAGLKGPEFAEAVRAFFDKRPPDFSGFE